ncbi:sulfotransferase [uncultured Croceicoccus sp.]|uniref:sulfotransferase n=1 Tax=uncultured Croceicoccus sp. TaxID=1295329 RepID=UPI002624C5AB|nr:sulfotransferase [uncultured Croceicoccus sp.]
MPSPEVTTAAAAFQAANRADDRPALLAAARVLVEKRAPIGPQWNFAAQAIMRCGDLDLALRALDLWQDQAAPPHAAAHEKAVLLAQSGREDDALALVAQLPETHPTPVANAYLRGSIAANLGRRDEAELHYRRAVAALPVSGRSWVGLAQLDRLTPADRAAIRARLDAPDASRIETVDRAGLHHALAIAADREQDHAKAFNHFDSATRIQAELYRYTARDDENSVRTARMWHAPDIARHAIAGPAPERQPIFVTGLARSGTTLVQQLLAAHSEVDGGRELGLTVPVEVMTGGFAPADFDRYRAGGGTMEALRDTYLRFAGQRIAGTGRFVDKTLNASRAIGPLAAMFPDAPFVWLRRDPLDNAWSIYRAWFSNNVLSGWSLADIAHHMMVEDRMHAHWADVLGDRMLTVPYADLVEHPEEWTRRITSFCGLEFEPGQMDFHRRAGAVSTASALQVREPVNRKGIGASAPYRRWLDPFMRVYRAAPVDTPPDPATLVAGFKDGLARQDILAINHAAKGLIVAKAPMGNSWRAIAQALLRNGEKTAARDAMRLLEENGGNTRALRIERAAFVARSGLPEDARQLLSEGTGNAQDASASLQFLHGSIATNLGEAEVAAEHFRRAAGMQPASGQCWLGLAMTGAADDADHRAMEDASAALAHAPPAERSAWHYALGHMRHLAGEHARAFDAFEKGAAHMAPLRPFDREADRADARAAVDGWAEGLRDTRGADRRKPVRDPVFVTGLPRSGSTLVEQILAAHSTVAGGGELGLLRLLEQRIGGKSHGAFARWERDGGRADDLVAHYDHLLNESVTRDGRVIEKTLSTSRHLGLVATLLPDAPVVWVRRDPLDNAWSAYRTWFVEGVAWSWNQADIAAHMACEDALHDRWQDVLGDRMLTIAYETLVDDPTTQIGRILDHCGLTREAACFAPHETKRSVITASAMQVRAPINRRGIGVADPYRDRLAPFEAARFGNDTLL